MTQSSLPVYPVLLAGGSGTRLWPVSRELYPKQLVRFIGKDSLIQSTLKRLRPVLDIQKSIVVCGREHACDITRHIASIGVSNGGNVITEPCGRNTAPAILMALFHILQHEPDAILCIFPADHVIQNIAGFHAKLEAAIRLAHQEYIVTFGIQPGYPETGYGYIEGDIPLPEGALGIRRFVEKPDMNTAKEYLAAGNFFWNSGMFAFKASVAISEFKRFQPELYHDMETLLASEKEMSAETYQNLPNISIDVAIMEKTRSGAVLPSDFGWSDIGSWKSLYDFLPKDEHHNVLNGDVIVHNSHNCFVMGHERLIAVNHLRNAVIVETPDSIFVSDIENSRDVKTIVSALKEKGRWEYQQHTTASRPWGSFTSLEMKDAYQIGRMIVYPGSQLTVMADSSEFLTLIPVEGAGSIQADTDAVSRNLKANESVTLASGQQAVINNDYTDPLILIHVRTGSGTPPVNGKP